jgi:hypothetical protein
MRILTFTNGAGRILATAGIPEEVLTEGNHGDVKSFDVSAKVIRGGRISQFICVLPSGEAIKGDVVKKPEGGPGVFALDRLEVQPGEAIKGAFQALTVKDKSSEKGAPQC